MAVNPASIVKVTNGVDDLGICLRLFLHGGRVVVDEGRDFALVSLDTLLFLESAL